MSAADILKDAPVPEEGEADDPAPPGDPPTEAECVELRSQAAVYILKWSKLLSRKLPGADENDLAQVGRELVTKRLPRYRKGKAGFVTFIYRGLFGAMYEQAKKDHRAWSELRGALDAEGAFLGSYEIEGLPGSPAMAAADVQAFARGQATAFAAGYLLHDTALPPDEAVAAREIRAHLRAAVAKLDPAHARAIDLCVVKREKQDDVAAQMGVKGRTVRRYLEAGYATLRQEMLAVDVTGAHDLGSSEAG
jgi:RNA polymerase sigma factor (sigma-70 family)